MSKKDMDVPLAELIGKVVKGIDLSAIESEAVFDRFMEGSASEIEMAGLLAALQTKGANHREIAGGIRALRKAMVRIISLEPERLVDIRRNRINTLKEKKATTYIDYEKISKEVVEAKQLFKKYNWPIVDVTRKSVEETAASVIKIYEIVKQNV